MFLRYHVDTGSWTQVPCKYNKYSKLPSHLSSLGIWFWSYNNSSQKQTQKINGPFCIFQAYMNTSDSPFFYLLWIVLNYSQYFQFPWYCILVTSILSHLEKKEAILFLTSVMSLPITYAYHLSCSTQKVTTMYTNSKTIKTVGGLLI